MNTSNKESANNICNAVGVIVLMFAQWLISVILVRISGFEMAGRFSLAMSISNIFYAIQNYQMRNYQLSDSRQKYPEKQYRLAREMLILISFVFCIIYLRFMGYGIRNSLAIVFYLAYSATYMISDTLMIPLQREGYLYITGVSNIIRGGAAFVSFFISFL